MNESAGEYLKRMMTTNIASNRLTQARLEAERAAGEEDKARRHFWIPEYQYEYLRILGVANGMTRAAILRTIIDEWVNDKLPPKP